MSVLQFVPLEPPETDNFVSPAPAEPSDQSARPAAPAPADRPDPAALWRAIDETMIADQSRLRARYGSVERLAGRGGDFAAAYADVVAEVERSRATRRARLANLPRPAFTQLLPVVERRDEIARAIAENQVLVLSGETGSGKTTQLPKICLAARPRRRRVDRHTQYAPHRRPQRGDAHRGGTRLVARRGRRLQGASTTRCRRGRT